MAATSNKGTFQPDSDVHITYEDQQKINRFARLNAKLDDYKEEIKIKENDLKSLEDACDEIALFDDDEQIPYLVGEVFIYQNTETTQLNLAWLLKCADGEGESSYNRETVRAVTKCLEEAKKRIEEEIEELKNKSSEVREIMGDLKSHLYGRFGSHINLEADEE